MAEDGSPLVRESNRKWRLGFWSLIATQFQGAFNDNGLKFFVIFLILGTHPTDSQKDLLVFYVGNLFAVPFLLFSMAGGYLADRFSKSNGAIGTKICEIFAMLFAIYAFAQGSTRMAFAVIFLASTQAAFFGPAKYGLLPEVLPDELLSWGNGILELTTFLAIIAGAVAGPLLAQRFHGRELYAGLLFSACTLFGLATSFTISRVPAADPSRKFRFNIFGDLIKQVQIVRPDRTLQLRCRAPFRGENRVRADPAGRHRHVIVCFRDISSRPHLSSGSAAAGLFWILGRLLHCSHQCVNPTLVRRRQERQCHRVCKFPVLHRSYRRVCDLLRIHALFARRAAVVLHLDGNYVARGPSLRPLAVAGLAAAVIAVDAHAHALPAC